MRIRKNTTTPEDGDIQVMAKVSDALAHPARIRIFKFIMERNKEFAPVCNKDIVANFDYAQATISQHLSLLVQSDLIYAERKHKFSYYYVNIGVLSKYLDMVKSFGK